METIESAVKDVIGPSYNYADHIIYPEKLQISGKGDVKYLWKDLGGMAAYVDTLTFGNKAVSQLWDNAPNQKPLGNKYFIKFRTCGDKSTEECKGKDRYIFIDNIPTGKIPCLDQIGIHLPAIFPFKGLVPGLLEDVAKVNPIAIFNSLAGKGGISNVCSMRKENVGYEGNYTSVSKCSPPTPPVQCLPQISEPFQNIQNNKNKIYDDYKKYIFFIAFCLIIILIFFFSYKNK